MAECPGGRNTRGTRSQFRLGTVGLGLCRGFYPTHLGNIMDVGQSSQPGTWYSRDPVSPSEGTRTRTVREYEKTISELKKENFDLKLNIYFLHEATLKYKDKDAPSSEDIQVIVKLTSEAFKKDMLDKDKFLQDTLERAEKYEFDFKELEKKYAELQSQLSSLSELPSKDEYLSLRDEKESLVHLTKSLEKALTEKDQEIELLNQKIEILASQNKILEDKLKKRSTAIQGLVYKNCKEKEMFPDDLRNIVISATQAAKNGNKDSLAIAVKSFSSKLYQMSSPLNESEKENIESPQTKCLKIKKEILEKSTSFPTSQNVSSTEISHIQSLKEVLAERNTPESEVLRSLDSFVQESCVKRTSLCESAVNIAERDILDYVHFPASPSVETENLISFSNEQSPESCSVGEHKLVNIETVSASAISADLRTSDVASFLNKSSKESNQIMNLLKENEKLRLEREEKLAIIQDLQATCKKLELRGINLKVDDALKASWELYSVCTQTDFAGFNLLNEDEVAKLQKDAKQSNSLEEQGEEIRKLLLAVEDKNKELADKNKELENVKQSYLAVQEDLKKALSTTNTFEKDSYVNEINELHERLAMSCSVNENLLKHLKYLERFMEDLLQNKLNTSIESTSDKSDVVTSVSRCLNESLKCSYALSDHLSICEGSKLFEECESFVNLYKSSSFSEEKSLPQLDLSQLDLPELRSSSYPGTHILEDYIPLAKKSDRRMGKESDGSSQLCWRCWQQLNAPMNQNEVSHQIDNTLVHKNMGYPSSESDIWSEPDRNISMQRIGISLQNSPVSSKSPRKLRQKEKRMSARLSSDQDTSSRESQRLFKKRHGFASRRLFSKELIKNIDCTSEKFYYLLVEKYSKLKSLLDELGNVANGKVSEEVWIRLNAVVASLGEALQKLHIARENAKNFPSAVCGKCVMFELFTDVKASYKEADFYIDDSSSEQEILQQFLKEINLLKEACKEPFSLFSEIIDKRSQSTQSDSSSESEHIKISDLENVIVDLNAKNKALSKELHDKKKLLEKQKEELESVIVENLKLTDQLKHMEDELSVMKQKEKELSLRNEELTVELENVNKNNSELELVLKELDKKRKESDIKFDQLTSELKKTKLDLVNMNKKCLDCENELSQQTSKKKESEEKLKILESISLNEKHSYLSQINDLNEEKNHCVKELERVEENRLALEQENAILNKNLKSKDSELVSLQESIQKLKVAKDTLNANYAELRTELDKAKEHVVHLKKKCSSYENEFLPSCQEKEAEYCRQLQQLHLNLQEKEAEYSKQLKQLETEYQEKKAGYCQQLVQLEAKCQEKEVEYCQQLKQLEAKALDEKQRLEKEISLLVHEREDILQNLKNGKECIEKLKTEMTALNQSYVQSCQQVTNLTLLNEELQRRQSNLIQKSEFFEKALNSSNSECEILSQDLKCLRETLQNLQSECLMYEKKLVAASGMKSSLIECLLNINKDFNSQRKKLNEIFKAYGQENSLLWDETSEFIQDIGESNVQKLCANVGSESKKILQLVDILLGFLKSMHLRSETKVLEERRKSAGCANTIGFYETQIEHLKSENKNYQRVIGETQKAISEKELSAVSSAYEIQLLKEKLQNTEKEIKMTSQLLEKKEAEVEHLKSQNDSLQRVIDDRYESTSEKERSTESSIYEIPLLKEKLGSTQKEIERTNQLLEKKEAEIEHLKSQNNCSQQVIDETQKVIFEKEKSAQSSAYQIQLLEEKLHSTEKEIKKTNQLMEKKEAEVEHLKSLNSSLQKVIDERHESTSEKEKSAQSRLYEIQLLKEKLQNAEREIEKRSLLLEKKEAETDHLKSQNDKFQGVIDAIRKSTSEEGKLYYTEREVERANQVLKTKEAEIEHLKLQIDNLQKVIEKTQKSISEKEKSIQFSAYEIQSLKEKLHNKEEEIEKENRRLEKKDDEITKLQERVFDLQSSLNNIMAEKINLRSRTSSFEGNFLEDSIPSDNQLPSKPCLKTSKSCQTNAYEDLSQSVEDSFASTSTLDSVKNSCCEKYWKKCYSLQTKLAMRKKHIEILEKEKNDLRESFLEQLQNKEDSSERKDSLFAKVVELESKLEQRKTFINELKGELLKTCNSLIDKEKELDDMKAKLLEYKTKSKDSSPSGVDKHSAETTVEANIRTLTNHKWKLIQTIFDIQKKFYEKRGIHLNYFERFKEHVSNLYSMQLKQSVKKSNSMPILGSDASKLPCDQRSRVNNIVGLEVDIECLENLKIFLDRFFVPYVLEKSQSDIKLAESEKEKKKVLSDKLISPAVVEKSKLQKTDILHISFPDMFTAHLSSVHKGSLQEKNFRFENFASNISHHLDCIEKFFTSIRNCQWLASFDTSARDSTDEAEAKSLLIKIFQEIKLLHERSHKLFDLNSVLKNFDFVVPAPLPISSNKIDISDRESLMSEETIAVSRSESPLSFEDACPIKLPNPELLKLEEKTLKPETEQNRLGVVEPYSVKVTAIGSSCDSVCQRSHFSSPDLGIESDPNHDSSAPEQKEDSVHKYQRSILEEQKFIAKTQQKTAFTNTESAGRWSGHKFGEALFAIGNLPHYELLKKEVKESLVAIKSVLSRTGDGLQHIAKYTSPRKTLEYSTLKSIKDTCFHIEACLKAANELVGTFWTAPCPSEKEWKFLNDENHSLVEQLTRLRAMIQKQERDFKTAMGKLEHAQVVKASLDKKISKKLVKTKNIVRQTEQKLLEYGCQNFPPVPKYPSDQTEQTHQEQNV